MTGFSQQLNRWLARTSACLFSVLAMTGCSVFQSESHVVEMEPAVSPYAVASADEAFVAEPFSLIAADSVGLATFGLEIAQWADTPPTESLAQFEH